MKCRNLLLLDIGKAVYWYFMQNACIQMQLHNITIFIYYVSAYTIFPLGNTNCHPVKQSLPQTSARHTQHTLPHYTTPAHNVSPMTSLHSHNYNSPYQVTQYPVQNACAPTNIDLLNSTSSASLFTHSSLQPVTSYTAFDSHDVLSWAYWFNIIILYSHEVLTVLSVMLGPCSWWIHNGCKHITNNIFMVLSLVWLQLIKIYHTWRNNAEQLIRRQHGA